MRGAGCQLADVAELWYDVVRQFTFDNPIAKIAENLVPPVGIADQATRFEGVDHEALSGIGDLPDVVAAFDEAISVKHLESVIQPFGAHNARG